MTLAGSRQPRWHVLVPTRGTPDAVRRVHRNIASRLPESSVTLILNPPETSEDAEDGRLIAAELGIAALVCRGGGASRARNAGVESASGPLLVFLDDDVVVTAEAIETLVSTMERTGAAVGTARVIPADMTAPTTALWQRYLGFDRGPTTQVWGGGGAAKVLSPFGVWAFGVGAAFALNMPLLAGSDGGPRFDERLSNGCRCGGTEDVDFFYAVHTRGLGLVYVADAVVQHLFPSDLRELRAKCRQYALADGAFYAKWMRRASAGDLAAELAGWLRRVRLHWRLSLVGEAAVPLRTLLAEPMYKLLGVVDWNLRRLSPCSPRTRCPAPH